MGVEERCITHGPKPGQLLQGLVLGKFTFSFYILKPQGGGRQTSEIFQKLTWQSVGY